MTQAEKLNALLAQNPELQAIANTDPHVYSWFKLCNKGDITVEKALTGALLDTYKLKQKISNSYTHLLINKEQIS